LNDHQAREKLIGVAVNLVLLLREQLVRALPTLILGTQFRNAGGDFDRDGVFTILNMALFVAIFE